MSLSYIFIEIPTKRINYPIIMIVALIFDIKVCVYLWRSFFKYENF